MSYRDSCLPHFTSSPSRGGHRRRRSSLWILMCAVAVCELCVGLCASRTVRTLSGALAGVVLTPRHRDLGAVEVFRGVPYAAPPERFAPPAPPVVWSGVRTAGHFAPACPQLIPDVSNETLPLQRMPRGRLEHIRRTLPLLANQSEDCLYLNIYTPLHASPSTRYPVLVWVHGEGFSWGSGHLLDGSVLASYGRLVVVTLGYRLGLLGFLNPGPLHRSAANLGLLDLAAALQWVQANIHSFGGDSAAVTVTGHGSGAACVHWLMSSPVVAHGRLFHRAVLMSGAATAPSSLVKDPGRVARLVAQHSACPEDHQMLQCLRMRPLEALLSTPLPESQFSPLFGPSEDGVVIVSDQLKMNRNGFRRASYQFSSFHGVDSLTLRHKKIAKYDLMLGLVKAEAFPYFSEDDILFGIETERKTQILQNFINHTYRYHQTEILATLVNEYTGWERPVQHPLNTLQETMEALSDGLVGAPLVRAADLHSGGCYMYVISHQPRTGYPQKQGCVHGEELPLVLGAPLVAGHHNYTKVEAHLSETLMTYWANFAATGNPNKGRVPKHLLGERSERHKTWLPYDRVHKRYLLIDTKSKMRNHYRAHRLSFWLNLVPQLHRGADDLPLSHHQLTEPPS